MWVGGSVSWERDLRSVAEEEERKICYWDVGIEDCMEVLTAGIGAPEKLCPPEILARCEGHARGGEQEEDCDLQLDMGY